MINKLLLYFTIILSLSGCFQTKQVVNVPNVKFKLVYEQNILEINFTKVSSGRNNNLIFKGNVNIVERQTGPLYVNLRCIEFQNNTQETLNFWLDSIGSPSMANMSTELFLVNDFALSVPCDQDLTNGCLNNEAHSFLDSLTVTIRDNCPLFQDKKTVITGKH